MAIEQEIFDISLTTSTDLSGKQFYAVIGSGDYGVAIADAANEGTVGILQNKPDTTNTTAQVRVVGISKGLLGEAISAAWTALTPNASGELVEAAAGERYICKNMEAGADGAIISVLMEFGRVAAE